ncbi:MAG: long-chain fatty acid--CoA ligase [Gemmatimonadota bacterium]
MSQHTRASNDTPVPKSTLVDLFFEAMDRHRGRVALQRVASDMSVSDVRYEDVLSVVKQFVAALEGRGIVRGERVAILSENRPEWAMADYGCLCAGVLDVPVYATLKPHQVAYILENSGARLVFVSTAEQMEKALAAVDQVGRPVDVVIFDQPTVLPRGVISWQAFLDSGRTRARSWSDEDFREAASRAGPDDVATLIYTSGTTGEPKGVMLTHNNLASNVRAADMVFDITSTDSTVSFLPLSHVLQRMVDYLFFWVGCRIAYPRSIKTLVDDLKVIRPTVVVSVPRIYEKVYNGVMDAHGLKKALVDWAVGVADRAADLMLDGRRPGGWLGLQYRLADKLVFSKVKRAVGGRIRFFVSGGGPLAPELNRFFYSVGLTILEGYGLTETSPVTNVNTLEHFRIGTVGKPIPGTEIRIADDGEILVRGPQVMKGYYDNPDATAEVIDGDGWLATGDIGELDDEGYLSITDRKKDIIVTAGGKNVAPQPIENRLKTNPLVEQAIMIGDRRRYCVMLLVPAFGPLESWAGGQGIRWSTRKELLADPRVVAHVEEQARGMLDDLASYEMPKKFALLPEELTEENGFLTPSLKVKRRVVNERFDDLIDDLYADEAADTVQ